MCLFRSSIKHSVLFHCPTPSVCLRLLLFMFSTWSVNCFLSPSCRQTGMWAAGMSLTFDISFCLLIVACGFLISSLSVVSVRSDSVLNDCILTRGSDSRDFKKVGRNSQVKRELPRNKRVTCLYLCLRCSRRFPGKTVVYRRSYQTRREPFHWHE